MEYPLISEYREAILSAEDNFNELDSLRPVLDSHGDPVMSSGNFAVVFKMKDENDGRLYAVKCFIKDQEGRDESYRKIADELEVISSSYILPLRFLENELFVDSSQCDREEFPIVIMEWVEGETLDVYLKRNLNDKYALEMLSYRFNHMSAWLLAQPFAHGDLKPDNILVREDGSLVLVDYDGMFVPSMKGEKAREIGSPDYRHPLRTDSDFNEHIDDFSIAVIALSLKVISINPIIKINNIGWDYLLFSEFDLINPNLSSIFKIIFSLQPNKDLSLLLGVFWIALSEKSLHKINPDLFHTEKPTSRLLPLSLKDQKDRRERVIKIRKLFTGCQVKDSDLMDCYQDEYGVKYSIDKKRLLNYSVKFPGMGCKNELYIRRWSKNRNQKKYTIIDNTTVICNNAFYQCNNIEEIVLPFSVTVLGQSAFAFCKNLTSIFIPNSVKAIGSDAFHGCSSLDYLTLPSSIIHIGSDAFSLCDNLSHISLPDSLMNIPESLFYGCSSLRDIDLPPGLDSIGESAFNGCTSLKEIHLPNSVKQIGDNVFSNCPSLEIITLPNEIEIIGNFAFEECQKLAKINVPNSVKTIGSNPFKGIFPHLEIHTEDFFIDNGLLLGDGGKRLIACILNKPYICVPPTVEVIGDYAFYKCSNLSDITLPNSLQEIGKGAFKNCENLTNINLPQSLKTINDYAFENCSKIQNINLPMSISNIGEGIFYKCTSLKSIVIKSLQVIHKHTFEDCVNLENAELPQNLIIIEEEVFKNCTKLKQLILPPSLKQIYDDSFEGCWHLRSIELPKDCKKLKSRCLTT